MPTFEFGAFESKEVNMPILFSGRVTACKLCVTSVEQIPVLERFGSLKSTFIVETLDFHTEIVFGASPLIALPC